MMTLVDGPEEVRAGAANPVEQSCARAARPMALVINPDPSIRCVLANMLADQGYAIMEASNGYSGLRLVEQRHPDLILLEPVLSEVSGLVLLRELERDPSLRDIPVIVVSAFVHRVRDSLAHLVVGFVQTPLDLDELLTLVRRAHEGARHVPLPLSPPRR